MNKNSNEDKKEVIKDGIVIDALPATTFRVEIDGENVLAHLSGKMRIHHIRVYPGDKVSVRLSEDGKRGIIVRRL